MYSRENLPGDVMMHARPVPGFQKRTPDELLRKVDVYFDEGNWRRVVRLAIDPPRDLSHCIQSIQSAFIEKLGSFGAPTFLDKKRIEVYVSFNGIPHLVPDEDRFTTILATNQTFHARLSPDLGAFHTQEA